jgi:hypothetical protein
VPVTAAAAAVPITATAAAVLHARAATATTTHLRARDTYAADQCRCCEYNHCKSFHDISPICVGLD